MARCDVCCRRPPRRRAIHGLPHEAAVSRRALDAYRSAYVGGLERAALAPHWRRLPDYVVACPRASLGCGHACARSRAAAHLQGECAHGRVRLAFADDAALRRARHR
jgi:hypothetical protein